MIKVCRLSVPIILAVMMTSVLIYMSRESSRALGAGLQSDLVVTTLLDNSTPDGLCSLREAIEAANTNSLVQDCGTGDVFTDTITFSGGGVITVSSQLSVTAGGPLVIHGEGIISISGNNDVRIFYVEPGGELELNGLTLRDGSVDNGAGIFNTADLAITNCNLFGNDAGFGGGIYNTGNLLITASTLESNAAWGTYGSGGAIYNTGNMDIINSTLTGNVAFYHTGGGIYNQGTLAISDTLLSGNSAYHDGGVIYNNEGTVTIMNSIFSGGGVNYKGGGILNYSGTISITNSTLTNLHALYGGGIYNQYGIMNMENDTFYDNTASYDGGAIYNDHSTTMSLTNSTVSANSAGWWGGGIKNNTGDLIINNTTITENNADAGGGINGGASTSNTIIANNPTGGDCSDYLADGGHNISSDDSCGFSPDNNSMPNTDPLLGALQDNGGPTWTHALLVDSPAIDAGNDNLCPSTDQRGVMRPIDGDGDGNAICDIGSFEFESGFFIVNTLEDAVANDGFCALREAIQAANTNTSMTDCGMGTVLTDTITFIITGTINLGSQLEVTGGGPLVIDAGDVITTNGGLSTRVWWVDQDSELTLQHLTISNGSAINDEGAGLQNEGNISIIGCHFSNNHAYFYGGGISNSGILYISGSTFSENSAERGGGFYNELDGTFTINDSTFSGNQANGSGGGIYNYNFFLAPTLSNLIILDNVANWGGGIYNNGAITVTSSVISDNFALDGGGIYNQNGRLTILESTIQANHVSYNGGGILNVSYNQDGVLSTGYTTTISNSTLSNNTATEMGGGIRSDMSPLIIINSTLSANFAGIGGGGVSSNVGTLAILNSTFSGNGADYGGGIWVYGEATITNTIITNSPSGGDCSIAGGVITDGGHNISSDNSCGFTSENDSMPNTNPLLGPLQDNGGPTWTHALLEDSPAIDAGDDALCPLTDQRGVARPQDGDNDGFASCDIGSYEREPQPQAPTSVTISGPIEGEAGVVIYFTATVEPISATLPITFFWQASDQSPITETSGITDTVSWAWEEPGTQVITVTASNEVGQVTDSHEITIALPTNYSYLPLVIIFR